MNLPFLQPLIGGVLIGLASWLLLASLGRVAGVSGITAEVVKPSADSATDLGWRWAFLMGLIGGGALFAVALATPNLAVRPLWLLIVAGLAVGWGTVKAGGCTSGHGVCGLGRRSVRSLVAVLVFMATGALSVFIINAVTGKPMLQALRNLS